MAGGGWEDVLKWRFLASYPPSGTQCVLALPTGQPDSLSTQSLWLWTSWAHGASFLTCPSLLFGVLTARNWSCLFYSVTNTLLLFCCLSFSYEMASFIFCSFLQNFIHWVLLQWYLGSWTSCEPNCVRTELDFPTRSTNTDPNYWIWFSSHPIRFSAKLWKELSS